MKIKSWEHYISPNGEFDDDKYYDDGSYEIKNSDGSRDFYGGDGSWGEISSDGSGYYYGADGSRGERDSDGSSIFYYPDGSWEERYPDGSGMYYGSDGSCEDLDLRECDEDIEDELYSDYIPDAKEYALILKGLFGKNLNSNSTTKCRKNTFADYEEYDDLEAVDAALDSLYDDEYHYNNMPVFHGVIKESYGDVWIKRVKALLFKHKKIVVGYSSESLKGKSSDEVYAILFNCGFNNIKRVEIKDIYTNSRYRDNEVEKVTIDGQEKFDANSEYPYNVIVIITVHQNKEIVMPFSSSELKGLDCYNLRTRLSSLGFTKIDTFQVKDLVTGWFTKEGSVSKVIVNGNASFKKNTVFKYDVQIIIFYHKFKK